MLTQILIGIIALIHLFILWLEMFAWETTGKKVFRTIPKDLFAPTKTMMANQGLYNGFLAAGLIWTFFISDETWRMNVSIFFLSCVAIAGVFGAVTASRTILYVQSVPAAVALLLLFFL
ncbi:MAG: DUF1304 domain-containing protein [Salibacteraceae bacterium]